MPKHKSLTLSPRYRDFVNGRDRVLEAILNKYLMAIDRVVGGLRIRTEELYSRAKVIGAHRHDGGIEASLDPLFREASLEINYLFRRMRGTVYAISHAGEAEAIARALGKPQKTAIPKTKVITQIEKETPSGGAIQDRVEVALFTLKSKVLRAIKMAEIMKDSPAKAIVKIRRAFPHITDISKGPKVLRRLKPMREADKPNLTFGVIDKDTWDQALTDYAEDDIPGPRGPDDKMILFSVGDQGDVEFHERYEWEIEQEVTQDFVEQVRDGQIDAANENGIDDFMWIAVSDDHTDECCLSRDGLSSSEIESQLKSGKIDSELCDAEVPPAHFNCRCVPAPISSDLPDTAPPDYGSFDDWLDSKRAA